MGSVGAFDAMAESYDRKFTAGTLGAMMRRAVWARCSVRFSPGSRVLELNCGTGEDARWLVRQGMQVLATDISASMLKVARDKLAAEPRAAAARFQCLAWEDLHRLDEPAFDGALSNFGGLNCVSDMREAARALAAKLRPGAPAVLCIMGPTVPWEWAWFLARGRPGAAFRRLRRGGAVWSGLRIHYPSIKDARRAFAPEFRMLRVGAIGALLPPPYAEQWMGRHPGAAATLDRWERRIEALWPAPLLADHFLLELQRV